MGRKITMKKNLVYYSVGLQDIYSDIVKLSINSIDNSNNEPIDIVIITDQEYYDKNFISYERERTFFYIVSPIKNSDEVCFNKTRVFEWNGISEYENILYLDGDTLVNYNLEKIFNKCSSEDKLYVVVQDYSIEIHRHIHFSLGNYTQKDIDFFRGNEIYTFNCGIFLFKNSYLMEKHFSNVYSIMMNWPSEFFADQSFMNFYFNSYGLTISTQIRKEIDLVYVVEENIDWITDFTQKIFHFLGNTYNGESKIDKIKKFKEKIKNYD